MSRRLCAVGACVAVIQAGAALAAYQVAGRVAAAQEITRAGAKPSAVGPSDYFTGRVRLDPVWPADEDINASGALVTFEPGARSAWHTHPKGQRLWVVSGVGLTQEVGKPAQEIRPGDVVWCPPGVRHTMVSVTTAIGMLASFCAPAMAAAPSHQEHTTMNAQQTLSAKQQAIVPMAATMALGDMPQLNAALHHGLDVGLTISDAREILVQLYAYTGFPRSLNALGELMTVLESRRQRGVHDPAGRDPGPIPTGKELLALGTANQTRLSGAPVKGPLFEFAPAIDEYLKTHLFGDIFARDNVDWQSRELATMSALAAMSGVEPQVQAHIGIGMNVGLTASQLRQLADVLADRGHPAAAGRVRAALDKHVADAARH